jgi:hypothetical protein
MRALIALNERVASPSDLARDLEEPIGVVAYHVRQLVDLGCARLVKTKQRRGATEHYYAATTRPIFDKGWDKLPQEARTALSSGVLSEIWRDAGRAVTEGSFDARDDRHLSRTTLVLDEESWEELNARLAELVDWALGLQADAAGRLVEGEPAIVSKLALMHFTAREVEEAEQKPPKPKAGTTRRPRTKSATAR